jgi:hypothetical protein
MAISRGTPWRSAALLAALAGLLIACGAPAAAPISGDETERIVTGLQQTPAPVLARLKELLK